MSPAMAAAAAVTGRLTDAAQTVTGRDAVPHGFEIDAFRKQALLDGLDDIGLTLGHGAEIGAVETRRAAAWPWAVPGRLDAGAEG